jgi:GTP-binding protein Era
VSPDAVAGPGYRSGFACFVGRPNAGKSTLTNALTGTKVAITSSRPQTTRHAVRGIVHRPDAQLVLVDTPGLHKPRTLLGQRLNDIVRETYAGVDVVCFCVTADDKIGPGDRFIAAELEELKTPVIAVVTKTDKVSKQQVGEQLLAVSQLGDWAEIVPTSAVSDFQVSLLADLLVARLPEGPVLYPGRASSPTSRAGAHRRAHPRGGARGRRDELPHSIAVTVEEMHLREDRPEDRPLLDVYATLHVERDSQKAIILGTGGARLKGVGTTARHQIEALLGMRVYLDLHVSVAKDWQRDPKQLKKLGF